jgi:hypothetical protein
VGGEGAKAASASGPVELVVSYVCNSPSDSSLLFQEGHLDLYTPIFVKISVDARTPAVTG